MTSEIELRDLAEKHGYELLSVKRFRRRDRTTFLHKETGIRMSVTWRKHIEELDIYFDGVWKGKERGWIPPEDRRQALIGEIEA